MNTKQLFRYLLAITTIISLLLFLCACGGKNKSQKAATDSLAPQDVAPVIEQSNHTITVVLNSELGENNIAVIKQTLDKSFGMIDTGTGVIRTGLITYLMYPENFTREGIARVSDIKMAAENQTTRALIIAVPPRYMGNYLADIKTARPDMALLAALPESEVLPMEAWCDIVLSFALPAATGDETPDEEENIPATDIARMISLLVRTVEKSPLVQSSSQLLLSCREIASSPAQPGEKPWNLANYKDPDTGLKSTNHFVVMQERQR